jgi:epoxyqueuosine reductase
VLGCGFDRVGFAAAGRAPHAERFAQWLARGHDADMSYLARNAARRQDPRLVVPGARGVIAMALHYRAREGEDLEEASAGAGDAGTTGTISSYAQGEDYHRVLEKRLKTAAGALRARFPEETFRYYADTGPVLERAWAEAAGIGWIGKNACAIDPMRGSYFFIGVILTTLELSPDEPSANHCGSCRLCLDACPTAAIVAPYEIDARRCVSYLTIENRGPIPEALRAGVGGLVFGCDLCQEVCPFNRPANLPPAVTAELAARPENRAPRLAELAGLDHEAAFRERFPRSAVRRARFPGFLRNVVVAIGNSGQAGMAHLLDRVERRAAALGAAPVALAETIAWARRRLASGGGRSRGDPGEQLDPGERNPGRGEDE